MKDTERLDLTGAPAEIYERHLVPRCFLPWARDLVDLVGPKPGERALDVACGTGAVTRVVAERVAPEGRVVGFDVNAGMIAVARSLVSAPNIQWREASVLALPFGDGSFEFVICQQGLQFFPDQPLALRQMRRVLVPGGRRLGVSCWRTSAESPAYAAIEHALTRRLGSERGKPPPFSLSDAGQLRTLIEGAGFRQVEVESKTKMVEWPSTNLFVRATGVSAPTMLGSLAAQGDAVLTEIAAEVEAEVRPFRQADGGIKFPMGSNLLTARA
jgi:ubiquinone/menaquinone biosynthesis C-methylase UbiE